MYNRNYVTIILELKFEGIKIIKPDNQIVKLSVQILGVVGILTSGRLYNGIELRWIFSMDRNE